MRQGVITATSAVGHPESVAMADLQLNRFSGKPTHVQTAPFRGYGGYCNGKVEFGIPLPELELLPKETILPFDAVTMPLGKLLVITTPDRRTTDTFVPPPA